MLFESGGIKAGGGENWIPICLPAFNNQGYLYMYVSFFGGKADGLEPEVAATRSDRPGEEIAIILVSPDKESFYDLKEIRDKVTTQLTKKSSLAVIKAAAAAGRPQVAAVAPGCQISHFLYKNRANVQFCMSSLEPTFGSPVNRRRLMTLYQQLHSAVHARHAHLKVVHCEGEDAASLAWVTPAFEFYCVAGPNVSRAAITQGANKIIQWAKREEERLFIIGGGVF
jgi:hypothetical protein